MTSETLTRALEHARRDLATLASSEQDSEDATDALAELLDDLYDVGKALGASAGLRTSPELQRFLEEAIPVLKARQGDLLLRPWKIRYRFQGIWEDDEWIQLLVARSGLQFFIELFRETALAENVAELDTSDVDEFIRERGNEGNLTDEQIPPELPASHWWWWYPKEPRPR